MAYSYSVAAWTAAHQGLLDLIATGSGTPVIRIVDSQLNVLAEATIDTTASFVNDQNGKLTIAIGEQESASPIGGTAFEARIYNKNNALVMKMPCQVGSSAVAGYCVMNTLTILAGAPLEILQVSVDVGAVI